MTNYINQITTLEILSEQVANIRHGGHDVYSRDEVSKIIVGIYNLVEQNPDVKTIADNNSAEPLTDGQLEKVEKSVMEALKGIDWDDEANFDLHGNEISVDYDDRGLCQLIMESVQDNND